MGLERLIFFGMLVVLEGWVLPCVTEIIIMGSALLRQPFHVKHVSNNGRDHRPTRSCQFFPPPRSVVVENRWGVVGVTCIMRLSSLQRYWDASVLHVRRRMQGVDYTPQRLRRGGEALLGPRRASSMGG